MAGWLASKIQVDFEIIYFSTDCITSIVTEQLKSPLFACILLNEDPHNSYGVCSHLGSY